MYLVGVTRSTPSNNVICLLTLTSYRHDIKDEDFAFWLFQNISYLYYNLKDKKTAKLAKHLSLIPN